MTRFRAAPAHQIALAAAVPASAKRAPRKQAPAPQVDCRILSDSLVKLYDAGDPAYLTWDFAAAKCDSSQLYAAYYYQGIGFLFISAWKEALYFLNAARDIGGPKDEEILYHLWTIYRKLDRYPEMERLTLELHHRYPSSLFLMEILDEWKAVKAPSRIAWSYSTRAGVSSIAYLDNQLTNRLQAETHQESKLHRFRERASLSLTSRWTDSLSHAWNQRLLHGFQANLGFEYGWKGMTAEADWGAGYEAHGKDTTLVDAGGRQSVLVDSNWNFAQGRIALGYSHTTAGGWNLGVTAGLFQLNPDWRALSLSHSESILFSSLILIGYVEYQKHWIATGSGAAPDSATLFSFNLDGMQTYTASLTPYFTFGRHSFGIGPTWYASRTHTEVLDYLGGDQGLSSWQYSLSATGTYGFDLRRWCRLNASGSYGFNLDKHAKDPDFTFYSADAGLSVSF
jgi:hypothetical protein